MKMILLNKEKIRKENVQGLNKLEWYGMEEKPLMMSNGKLCIERPKSIMKNMDIY